jgi:ribosomal-protein-alanine N-acetyltransferase
MAARLRPASAADAPTLAALQSESFEDQWSPGAVVDLLAMPGAFALIAELGIAERDIAELGWAPRGFVLARAAAGEGEILSIAVHASARRQGLGRILAEAALKEAASRGAEAMFLEVAVDNGAARGLYTALGFAETGRRPAYYSRGAGAAVDALILKMDFPPGSA